MAIGDAATVANVFGITRTLVAERHIVLPGPGRSFRCRAAEGGQRSTPETLLACLEMLTTVTTTSVDSHYIHCDPEAFAGVAEAVAASGLRATLGRAAVDAPVVPERFRERPVDAARRAEDAIARWHGAASGRLRVRPGARGAVDTLLVDGRVLVDGGCVTTLDAAAAVMAEANAAGDRLRRQAGLGQ